MLHHDFVVSGRKLKKQQQKNEQKTKTKQKQPDYFIRSHLRNFIPTNIQIYFFYSTAEFGFKHRIM